MRNPPLPPLPTPSEPRRSSTTRRVWTDETVTMTGAQVGAPFEDEAPTHVLPARAPRWEADLDAPTISGPLVSSPLSGLPLAEGAIGGRRRITRNEWTLLIAAISIVILLVGSVAVVGLLSLSPSPNNSAAAGAGVPNAATATATATLAPSPSATPLPPIAANFATQDDTTQGAWQSQYGSQGYIIVGDTQQLPTSVQITPANQQEFLWADSTTDPRALVKASNAGDSIAACWYASNSFTIDVNITDGQTYELALYVLDWDQQNRAEIINILDPTTDTVLDTRSVTSFANGVYLVWNVRGHVAVQITNAPGSPNAVVSGVFIAPAAVPGATPTDTPSAVPTISPSPGSTPSPPADATPTDTPSA